MALIPEEPKKRNALIVGLLLVAGIYFFYSSWYTPHRENLETLEARLEQLENQNRQAQILATRGGRELEDRLAVYERHIFQLEQLIPQSEEVPALLESMASEARRTGIGDLTSMRPEPSEPGPFYTKQSYEISVIGEYHEVGRFLTAIASLPRIITPVDLEMSPFTNPTRSADASVADVTARFRIETYVLPDQSVQGPPEQPGTDAGGAE